MSLNFPFEMFGQQADRKRRDQQQMNSDIMGIGQGLGNTLGSVGEMIKQNKIKDIIAQMLKQGQGQGAGQPGMAGVGGVQTASQMPQPAMDPSMRAPLELMQADPSLLKESLPALIKGMGRQTRGQTDYRTAALNQNEQHFQQKEKDFQENMSYKKLMTDLANAKNMNAVKLTIKKFNLQNQSRWPWEAPPQIDESEFTGERDSSSGDAADARKSLGL